MVGKGGMYVMESQQTPAHLCPPAGPPTAETSIATLNLGYDQWAKRTGCAVSLNSENSLEISKCRELIYH